MRLLPWMLIALLASPAFAKIDPVADGQLTNQQTLDDCYATLRQAEAGDAQFRKRACMAQIIGFWDGYLAFVNSARAITEIRDECSDDRQKFYDMLRQRQPIPDAYVTTDEALDVMLLRGAIEMIERTRRNEGNIRGKDGWSKPSEFPIAAISQSYLTDKGTPPYLTTGDFPANADHAQLLDYPDLPTLRQRCTSDRDGHSYCVNYLYGTITGTIIGGWITPMDRVEECTENAYASQVVALGKQHPFGPMLQKEWEIFVTTQEEPIRKHDLRKAAEFFVWFLDRHPEWLSARNKDGKPLSFHELIVKIQTDQKEAKP